MVTHSRKKRGRVGERKKIKQRPKKVRLAVECTPTERKYMKMLAAHEKKTLEEFVLESVKMRFQECANSHTPNKETEAALEDAEQKRGLCQYGYIEELFKSLGK